MKNAAYSITALQGRRARMPTPRSGRLQLEELLLRHGAIDEEQLRRARQDQKTLGGDLGRILVDLGFITDGEPLRPTEPAAKADENLFDSAPQQALSNPQFAALVARVERLEQTSQREEQVLQALRAIGDILVDSGLISREEYLRRARGK